MIPITTLVLVYMARQAPIIQFPPQLNHQLRLAPRKSDSGSILERPFMEYRPFGETYTGEKVRDVSGITVQANIEFLKEIITQSKGHEEAESVIRHLCELLNHRIADSAYHVTPSLLGNVWNSYSYEFVCYLAEFCCHLSGDPLFQFNMGRQKFISPIIQTLGRPFSVMQIYKLFPHFGEKFAKGSIHFSVGVVTNGTAILRMKFTDHVYQQFGPYRQRCAELICQSARAGLASVPHFVHHLGFATITNHQCIANGDEYCEWEFRWPPQIQQASVFWTILSVVVGLTLLTYLHWKHPNFAWSESFIWSLLGGCTCWVWGQWINLRRQAALREPLIHEQIAFVEKRHEELRESYLEQERTSIELEQKVRQLTTLHQTGLLFSSTLDRESLLQQVLETIIQELPYDRAMIAFFDQKQGVSHDARILGVNSHVARLARSLRTPVYDPDSIEGQVLLQGKPILIGDLQKEWNRLHPFTQQLVQMANVKSIISVPLSVKGTIVGSLTVDRTQEHALTQDDVNLLITVGNQVAIALDNAQAYSQIEEMNASLESRIQERTSALQNANSKLQEVDKLKSTFVSVASHELRTPLTSIKGLVENMLDGFIGELNDRQSFYLTRIKHNVERLSRMTIDLLDLSRIEAGRMEMKMAPLVLLDLIAEVSHTLQPLVESKSLTLFTRHQTRLPSVIGDWDKVFQILTNLLHNAIKFSPTNGDITIEVKPYNAQCIQVCVSDQGKGIPPQDLTNIFESFYRSGASSTESQGAGLGLAITKSLVELHQGKIWMESEIEKGSRVFFTLPTKKIESSQKN